MRLKSLLLGVLPLSLCFAMPSVAAEIILEEDIVQQVIPIEELYRLTDNALFLFDTSSSMEEPYGDTGKSMLSALVAEFKRRNAYVPELGYKFGLYNYTPWEPIYELQTYDTLRVDAALDALPKKGSGPTRLSRGLEELAPILKKASGRTVVFVFTDGQYTGERRPGDIARRLAREHNVCFYVISTASEEKNRGIVERVAGINECSRVVPFSYFIDRPEYTTGGLFEVKAASLVVTSTETRIVGLEIDPIHFGFDSVELDETARTEVDEVGEFLAKNPGAYAVINGYTDTSGPEEHNLSLSRQRTESVAAHLKATHGVGEDRVIRHWYGSLNPVASNDTLEGRKKNRRIEMAVGGL